MYRILLLLLLFWGNNAYSQTKTIEKNATEKDKMKLYPNPAKTYTNIYVDWETARGFSITIYDIAYATQLSEWKIPVRKSYQYSLDVSKLPDGKYVISVISDKRNLSDTLTVMH